jgi:hypothetical protein
MASKTADAYAVDVAVCGRILVEVDAGLRTFVGEAGTSIDNYDEPEEDLVLENADNETAPDAAEPDQWTEANFLSGGGGGRDERLTVYEDNNPKGLMGTTNAK